MPYDATFNDCLPTWCYAPRIGFDKQPQPLYRLDNSRNETTTSSSLTALKSNVAKQPSTWGVQ